MKFQILIAFFFVMLNRIVTADERLIRATCSQTPHKDLCISALMSDRRSRSADTAGLALILVEQFAGKTKKAINIVNERARTTKDPKVLHALKECAELYYNAVIVGDVPMAIEGLRKGNPKFAEQGATDAAGEVHSCEEEFPHGTSPVSRLNNEIVKLAEVVASIAKQLE